MENRKIVRDNEFDTNWSYTRKRTFLRSHYDGVIQEFMTFKGDTDNFYAGRYFKELKQYGKRQFVKTVCISSVSYKKGKTYGSGIIDLIDFICESLKIKWVSNISPIIKCRFMSNSTIFKNIITGKIYSTETLIKYIGKRHFGLIHFNWKILYSYLSENISVSIGDLKDFTTDVDASMELLLTKDDGVKTLFSDILGCAKDLDEKINPRWSIKRFHKEHSRQIRIQNPEMIESTSKTPIYSVEKVQKLNSPHIKLLNSEQQTYIEGLDMSHCVYTVYWSRIASHNYLAFHMDYPEICTFGINLVDPTKLHQIYLAHNHCVKSSTREIAQKYISDNQELIMDLLKK